MGSCMGYMSAVVENSVSKFHYKRQGGNLDVTQASVKISLGF